MNPRICICCGEPMAQRGNALSRNPNMCACCSSLADGLDESDELQPPLDRSTQRHVGPASFNQEHQPDFEFVHAFGE